VTARYLLDTDTVSFAIRGFGRVKERILERTPGEIAVSALTEAELWFGVSKLGSRRLHRSVEGFLAGVEVLPFDRAAAREFGEIQAFLVARGRPVGVIDAMLAAHARSRDLCLVTHNRRHFDRVAQLSVEDWL
jgi:tRNA(fMet)-specific endonuclease VapC